MKKPLAVLTVLCVCVLSASAETGIRALNPTKWVTPSDHGTISANFETVVSADTPVKAIRLHVRNNFGRAVSDFGNCVLESRGDGVSIPVCAWEPLQTISSDMSLGVRVLDSFFAYKWRTNANEGIIPLGTNTLFLITERFPPSRLTGQSVFISLELTVGKGSEAIMLPAITVEARVRGRMSLTRIVFSPVSSFDFVVLSEGGLPTERYQLEESTNLVHWRWAYRLKQPDFAFGIRREGNYRSFYRVVPQNRLVPAAPSKRFNPIDRVK